MDLHLFWGKTPGASMPSGHPYKPILHHLIDVAAVAFRLQLSNRARLTREAALFGLDPERFARICAFLAGLHDLGKFSVPFQAKVRELWPAAILGPFPGPVADRGHWRNTAFMFCGPALRSGLGALFPGLDGRVAPIAASIAGHHGRPPPFDEIDVNPHKLARDRQITAPCMEAARAAMAILRDLLGPPPVPEIATDEQVRALSWRLAGLTTLADWVGSDAGFFRFEDPAMDATAYWALALQRADAAIAAKGLRPARMRSGAGLATLVPAQPPRPMQARIAEVALPDGPALFIVEDATGSGKTEAALVLAARLMAAGKAEGLYFALPTMATANAIFGRLGDIRPALFAKGATPSLVLAHGRAGLSRDVLPSASPATNGPDDAASADGESAARLCAEWIADDRRKAFFADIGAGTIDQAFLAVLEKRHLTLRQYGLAGKVLIVDEAHAFDAYMGRELEALLAVHAALGGSAIVLSATLPAARRQALATAFLDGPEGPADPVPEAAPYPLLTIVGRDGACEQAVPFCDALRRSVGLRRLEDAAAAHAAALDAARKGATVLVIRNAVDEAAASFAALKAGHSDTLLFHARFAMCDRQRIEREVLTCFGRDAGPEARAGRILVATQVVEQSLDLDFDFVISDLAPVDLLIQRAGRLWRHMAQRPREARPIDGPTLCFVTPDPAAATDKNWLEPALGRGAFVYRHPGLMWRTAAALSARGAVRVPEDLRPLIEEVYAGDEVPDFLRAGQDRAEGDHHADRFHAGSNLIDFAAGYPAVGMLEDDQEVGTRLGEVTVTLRLARRCGAGLVPWARDPADPDGSGRRAAQDWALSEVTVRAAWLGTTHPPAAPAPAIEAAKATWPAWERSRITIAVVAAGGEVEFPEADLRLRYERDAGLSKMQDDS